ncbi:MAG: methyltransferase domain-containing protein [Pseudonocardiaceae bacterium]|nr:methyltransferase domain-containing protein [Pseudonocardiaceae bacterium]
MRAHPDRIRWNERYAADQPCFTPHPLLAEALSAGFPAGPVLELACGRSGSALALAARRRTVVAVDVSDLALTQLAGEADRRGLRGYLECVEADVPSYDPGRRRFGLVLATLYWDPAAFRAGCEAVLPGGLIGWEALAADEPRQWRVSHGELGAGLPADFEVLTEALVISGRRRSTRLLARRRHDPSRTNSASNG